MLNNLTAKHHQQLAQRLSTKTLLTAICSCVLSFPSTVAADAACFANSDRIYGTASAIGIQGSLPACYFSQSTSSYSAFAIDSGIDNSVSGISIDSYTDYTQAYSEISVFASDTSMQLTAKPSGRFFHLKRSFNKVRALTSPLDKKIKGSRLYMKLRSEGAGVVWQINY